MVLKTFVMATHNKHKITELQRILEPLGIQVTTAELPEVEETGTTFEENAQLKARSGLPRQPVCPAWRMTPHFRGCTRRRAGRVFRPICRPGCH